MRNLAWLGVLGALLMVGGACGTEKTIETEVEVVTLECSPSVPTGVCESGSTCFEGECVASSSLCSPTNDEGLCADGMTCFAGGCVTAQDLCGPANPTGPCATGNSCLDGECVATASLCSTSNPDGECPAGKTCRGGLCTGSGTSEAACEEHVYTEQPVIAARTDITANASATAALSGVAVGDDFTVGTAGSAWRPMPPEAGVRFVAVEGTAGDGQFEVGASDAETASNLAAAINDNEYTSRMVKATAEGTTIVFEAVAEGFAGNGIGLAGSGGKFSVPGGATTGGIGSGKAILTVDGKQFKDASGDGNLDPYEDWRISPICRARDLVTRMSIPEKVGLMSEGSTLPDTSDGSLSPTARANLVVGNVRQALIRFSRSGSQMAASINTMQEFAEALPLGIPVVLTGDPVHGIRMSTNAASGVQSLSGSVFSEWPTPLGLGAANDKELTWLFGDTVRREFMAAGFRWQLGPIVDTATEPRWERVQGTFGENALAVAIHSKACVEGMQGSSDGDLRNGIAATVKHFPGAGTNEEGKDSHSYDGRYAAHPGRNLEYHLLPFQAVFDSNAASLMACYSIFKDYPEYDPAGVPSGFSREIITELGKERMGFSGMVTGDWGTAGGSAYGALQNLTAAQRAERWLNAGSHQYGSDASSAFQQAYDQGLVTAEQIDEAATKILEMTFKLGLFENPYVDAAKAEEIVRGPEAMTAGFNAQKRAIVLLENKGSLLPISGERLNQNDSNADGVVSVYYDGVKDSLSGSDSLSNLMDDYNYTSETVIDEQDITKADIAVLRITSRKGSYFGLDAGVPLSFDAPFPGNANDSNLAAAIRDRNRVIDAFRVRDGYTKADGTVVEPANPDLKIVLVMYMDRPSIVKPFINGLVTLDENAGEPGSYPMVSVEANIAQGGKGVDAFLVDFGAYDRALLDFLFNVNVPEGAERHGEARLPMEIPSSDAEVAAQYEDMPHDTRNPTYRIGAGMTL